MEIFEITTFVKVVQTGSITRAAELLNTQKSNVSRVISNLEKKLQVRLFERDTRKLMITPVGKNIYDKCELILATLNEAENIAREEVNSPQGLLRITCGVEFGMLFVSYWINQFMQTYPQVSVDANYSNEIIDLIQDGYDLAIRLGELEDSSLVAKRLGQMQYGLYAKQTYLDEFGQPEHPSELLQHNCIVFNAGIKNVWPFLIDKRTVDISVKGSLKFNILFAVLKATEQGIGIARLPIGLPEREGSQLVRVLENFDVPAVPIYAVFPSKQFVTPKVRAFIELAAGECQQLVFA